MRTIHTWSTPVSPFRHASRIGPSFARIEAMSVRLRNLSRVVPFLVLMTGCFDSHTIYDGPRCRVPAGMVCCAGGFASTHWESLCPFSCPVTHDLVPAAECWAEGPRDAGPDTRPPVFDSGRRDTGPRDTGPPPGLVCPLRRPVAACSGAPGLVVVQGEPFQFPYRFDECGCCPETECVATVDPGAQTVDIYMTLCEDPCDCDACIPIEGSCRVPPIPFAGDWRVEVNGAPALVLPVRERAGGEPNPPGCATFADDAPCRLGDPLVSHAWSVTQACVRERAARRVIELVDGCASACDIQSTCISYLAGDSIVVEPFAASCADACVDVCARVVRHCEIPDLPPGDVVYPIVSGGRVVGQLGSGRLYTSSTECFDEDG